MVTANHSCAGKVLQLDIVGPGYVQVKIEGVGTGNRLCSLSEKLGEFTVEACQAVFSMALAAKMSENPLELHFRNDNDTSCNKGSWQILTNSEFQFYYARIEG